MNGIQAFVSLLIVLILFFGFFKMLSLASLFENKWVKITISIGLSGILTVMGIISAIAVFLYNLSAVFGAIGIIVLIIILNVLLFLMASNKDPISWLLKKKAKTNKEIQEIRDKAVKEGAMKIFKSVVNPEDKK